MKIIRWGILGTGYVAKQFAQGLSSLPDAKLLAVGSRKLETAGIFARQFNVPRKYKSYEELVADKDIDIVYIATPHVVHKDNCILCLEAGKATLCEKPFTINAKEAREVIELARKKRRFCMEAMWMRFIPIIQKTREIIDDGVIGEVKMLMADFGTQTEFDENDRHFNPDLGGGVLLDLGIYTISLAFYLLGPPLNIVSQSAFGKTKVDEQAAVIFHYAKGQLAILSSSLLTNMPNEAVIMGTKGQLRVHAPIYRPHKLSIQEFSQTPSSPSDVKQLNFSKLKQMPLIRRLYHSYVSPLIQLMHTRKIVIPYKGNGYNYEAAEAMKCLRNGECESKIMPLDETLSIVETMDAIRSQWGFKYPNEER